MFQLQQPIFVIFWSCQHLLFELPMNSSFHFLLWEALSSLCTISIISGADWLEGVFFRKAYGDQTPKKYRSISLARRSQTAGKGHQAPTMVQNEKHPNDLLM
jgi:hypothetical protein